MEHIYATRLQLYLGKLRELEEESSTLWTKSEIEVGDIIRLHIALKLNLNNLKSELINYSAQSTGVDQDLIKICIEVQSKAEEILIKAETLLELQKNRTVECRPSTMKLPVLELPKFKGDITNYSEFWDRFESAIGSRDFKDVEKLSYLIGCLEGAALDVVKGLSITNENYPIAVDMLRRHYGSKIKVIDAHYEALSKLKKATNVSTDCRFTLNCIQRHLRVLNSLGENTEGNHIRHLIRGKFPEKVLYELNVLKGSECTSKEVLEGLERIISAMESASNPDPEKDNKPGSSTEALHTQVFRKRPCPGRNEQSNPKAKKSNFRVKNTNIERNEYSFQSRKRTYPKSTQDHKDDRKKRRLNCIFCNEDHYNDKCGAAKTLDERKKKLKGKCYLCFKEGHFTKDCKTTKKCYHWKEGHNSALCPKKYGTKSHSSNQVINTDEIHSLTMSLKSFLQTATVKIQVTENKIKNCRLLLDSGSQRSYITQDLVKQLGLKPDSEDLLFIYTFGSDTPKEVISPATEINIVTKRGIQKQLKVNIVPYITTHIAAPDVPQSNLIDVLADDGSAGQQIDLLIGNNYYFSFIREDKIQLDENLYLIDTDFGWMPSGIIEANEEENILSVVTFCQCYRPDYPYFTEPDLPLRSIDVKFLWSLESIGIMDSPKASREEEAVDYFNNTVKYEKGRYQVKWPWVQFPPELPTNYGLAFGRLKGLLKRLDKDTIKEYDSILKEQLNAEIIEEVNKPVNPYEQCSPPIHYLPHHMVKQEGKRGRLVYDASARTKEEKSLNECLYKGPLLLEDLTALLLTFRTHKIGITADVEKAFLQVGLQEEDRDVTRFLWIRDIDKEPINDNIIHLRFTRVPFGIISSPFLLTATLRHHMSQKDKVLLKEVAEKCYVDNLVTGTNTIGEAINLYQRTQNIFAELSMNIRAWTSNDKNFLQTIPSEKQAKDEEVKVLGLIWNLNKDTLQLKFKNSSVEGNAKTRKDVLRTLARVYDPCGFVAPLVLAGKLLFQELCRRKVKWEENVPDDLLQSWNDFTENLKILKTIEIPRYLGFKEQNKPEFELHCFADASKNAYAAVVYLRINEENQSKTNFVMAKSRVAPLEEKDALKIPKLELLGCLIGCRLLKYVKDNMALNIKKTYLWTDSLIVLSWIRTNKLLPPFVSRRIDEIKQHKDVQPCYINTNDNPADLATRPDLWLKKKDLWYKGPKFLSQNETKWPQSRFLEFHRALLVAGEGQDADHPEEQQNEENLESNCSEMVKEDQSIGEEQDDDVHLEKEKEDEKTVAPVKEIKQLQRKYFPEEVKGKDTHLSRNLGLFMDVDGILRCKGRMSNTCWTYEMKHPILLPKDCELTKNVIQTTHERNYHVGTAHTLSLIRQQYWIPQGRAQVKKVITKCLQCQKHTNGPYKLPRPPALPAERVNYSSPFTYTGVDYLGPVFVSTDTEKVKRWICLYTCLAVRAIHLELVQDLTAEECLLALRRFISCRGVPQVIVSDNGTQFKLTSEVLSNSYCIQNKITWRFIPQLAPWHGGFYERLVALVKNCLKRTLEKHLLKDSQMVTVVKEIEAVINSRPLTNIGSELETVLRPSDFLSLGKCLVTEMSDKNICQDVTSTKRNLVEGWKKGQTVIEEFKHMFVNQYLLSLRERYNHSHKQPRSTSPRSPCIGDTVQIKGDSKNRSNWKIGKIVELVKGSDGQCRVAKVKIGDSIFVRSIGHLYPLEIEDDLPLVEEYEPLHDDIPSVVRNVTEQDVPVENPLFENMPVEQVPEIRELPEMPERLLRETLSETPELSNTTEPEERIITTPEPEDGTSQEEVVPVEPEDSTRPQENRVRRGAAIRAREKIAEWTRHLVALL